MVRNGGLANDAATETAFNAIVCRGVLRRKTQ